MSVDAATVAEALELFAHRYPRLRRHLYSELGTLRSYVNVFVNEQEIRTLTGTDTRIAADDTLLIVPSIAGGQDTGALTPDEMARYSRHIALAEIGPAGQLALKNGSVLVIGAGGLGSPVSLYLAAAGVGRIGIVDFDSIEITNLQRQVLYTSDDVGALKVETAVARLKDLNPEVDVVAHNIRLTSDNALEIIAAYDVVVDGTDNFATRYLANDACGLLGKPYVYGSILRFDGQVSVFDAKRGPCYRCLFREPPPAGLVPSCAEGGVLGALPGVIGSLQALEAIKLIAGAGEPLIGRLLLFDGLTMKWRELKLVKNPACVLCGDQPSITGLIDYDEFCGVTGDDGDMSSESEHDTEISVSELKTRLDNGERLVLVDVREPFEWSIANLGAYGATLMPMREVAERSGELSESAEIIVYCRSGNRSARVADYLRSAGFDKVLNLEGGILAWSREIDPSLPVY